MIDEYLVSMKTRWEDEYTFASSVILATRLTRMISENILNQFVGSLLKLIDDSVVQGILVLLEPAVDIVRHLETYTTFPISLSFLRK